MSQLAVRYSQEASHFDALVDQTGESWWGHSTAAGRWRLQRRARLVAKSLALAPLYMVMEIAAGAGALTETVLRRAPQANITATDISASSVRHLRQRVRGYPNVRCEQADITALGFDNETFDAVMGNSALHHVDVPTCLDELHRVLKPGGRLVIFEPNLANPEVCLETTLARRFATHKLDYSADERTHTRWTYGRMLRQAGFADVRVTPFDFMHPITPKPVLPLLAAVGSALEHTPLLREFSGSLMLTAVKRVSTEQTREA